IAQIFVKLLFALFKVVEPSFLPLTRKCIFGPEGVEKKHHPHEAAKRQSKSLAHCSITSFAARLASNSLMGSILHWRAGLLGNSFLANRPVPHQQKGPEKGGGQHCERGYPRHEVESVGPGGCEYRCAVFCGEAVEDLLVSHAVVDGGAQFRELNR